MESPHHPDPSPSLPPQLWDCGSSLYDSFELRSFQHQLDSALSSSSSSARSLSMPHLPPDAPPDFETPCPPRNRKSAGSKISRSLHKLVRSVFRRSRGASAVSFHLFGAQTKDSDRTREGRYVFVYDKSGALSTIPEVPEGEQASSSPELDALVRKTRSERFTASTGTIRIPSCA
ncbi:hypothetical protein MLD38_015584 [Melastoma candidum]|uniref:Uncharacterized protein n=1 Tax=Melastoma candidum TaxID=119954 RepID=A0ACB9RGH2_9MYRT|nr:hypothetical protein MLD38_015584 [Melastoma candidum]